MKKNILFLIIAIAFISSCKKDTQKDEDVILEKKCAKYTIQIYKDKDFSQWLATLAKAEYVDLLNIEKYTNKKNKIIEIAKVKLSDDSVGYTDLNYLADKSIVFLKETKAYIRNNISSKVITKIPVGKIGFIISEKGEWIKIYIGKLNSKWITKHWVNEGYSTDENLILDARDYEEAIEILNIKPDKQKSEKKEEAINKLKELTNHPNLFSELAKNKLEENSYPNINQETKNENSKNTIDNNIDKSEDSTEYQ